MDMTNQEQYMQEVNDEQLGAVSGGEAFGDGYRFYGHVGQYDGIVDNYYYIVSDSDPNLWAWGKLLRTWEDDIIFGFTKRRHKFHIVDTCDGPAEYDECYYGSDYSLYLFREKL